MAAGRAAAKSSELLINASVVIIVFQLLHDEFLYRQGL